MQIPIDTGVLDVLITWLEPDLLELNIVETRDCAVHYHATRYIAPEALATLADHIQDILAR
jgi:hypothetical protein